jgi:proline iminopeptidase
MACSEELARGISGARLVVFEQSGHLPFVEEPERFLRELNGFLESS